MNLHAIVSGAIGRVNPFVPIIIQRSKGSSTAPSGRRSPLYYPPRTISAQVQALAAEDLTALDGLNIQGEKRAVYINGRTDGIIRQDKKGGDLVIFNLNSANQFVGAISADQMIVDQVISGGIKIGQQIFGDQVAPGTFVTDFLAGRNGGPGVYQIDPMQTAPGPTLFSLQTFDQVANQFVGFITGDQLVIDEVIQGSIEPNQMIIGDGVLPKTIISGSITGSGGPGVYRIYPKQTVAGPMLFSVGVEVWLNVHVLEYWPDWCKFVITRQDGS